MSVLSHQSAVNPTINFFDVASASTYSTYIERATSLPDGVINNSTPVIIDSYNFIAPFTGRVCVTANCSFQLLGASVPPNQLSKITLSKTNSPTTSTLNQTTLRNQEEDNVSSLLSFSVTAGDAVNLTYTLTCISSVPAYRYFGPNWAIYMIAT